MLGRFARDPRLAGEWYGYHTTRDDRYDASPVWLESEWAVRAWRGGRVDARFRILHPQGGRGFRARGHLREGRLQLHAHAEGDAAESGFVMFPEIAAEGPLRGYLMANDWQGRPLLGRIVLMRDRLFSSRLSGQSFGPSPLDIAWAGGATRLLEPLSLPRRGHVGAGAPGSVLR